MNKKISAVGLIRAILFQTTGHRVLLIVFGAVGAALAGVCAFLGSAFGEEDYFSSVFLLIMAYYLPCFMVLLAFSMMGASRFLYSAPMAKRAITVGLPLLGAEICAAITVLIVGLTAISLRLGFADESRMSDTLVVCAFASLFILLCFALYHAGGLGLFGLCFGLLIFVFSIGASVTPRENWLDRLCRNGFGFPTRLAALLCIAAFAVGLPLSLLLAKKSYRLRSTKAMVNLPSVNG